MAMQKRANAQILERNVYKTEGWFSKTASAKDTSALLTTFNPDMWLLSHVTIMAGVDVEEAEPGKPMGDWWITPEHAQFVNNNGDAWERKLLVDTYKTFIGANNYCEHLQLPELSKGKVIDAVTRDVEIDNGLKALYVDILIATNREHREVVSKVENGEYNATSMGCNLDFSICTQCGNVAHDETQLCQHVRYYKINKYYAKDGKQRVIAELCGHHTKPGSVRFIDASWVAVPAFKGATLRSIITVPEFDRSKVNDAVDSFIQKTAVVEDEHHKAYGKAASINKKAEEPAADDLFPEAAPEAPAAEDPSRFGDAPAADDLFADDAAPAAPAGDAPPEDAAPAEGGDPAPAEGDAPAEEEKPAEPEVSEQDAINTSVDEIKSQLMGTILTQVKQDLMVRTRADSGVGTGDGPDRGTGNTYGDQASNDALVKWASSAPAVELLRSKFSTDVCEIANAIGGEAGIRVASALLVMSKLSSATALRKVGFSNEEIVAAASVLPTHLSGLDKKEASFLASQKYPVMDKQAFFVDALLAGVTLTGGAPKRLWGAAELLNS